MAERVDDKGAAYAGSQLQTQLYVNRRADQLNATVTAAFPDLAASTIEWRSPLAGDGYREYWDQRFLKRLGLQRLADDLKAFWPTGGPHWDALALVTTEGIDQTGVILAEGKSYPNELHGGGCGAKPGSESRKLIEKSLEWTQERLAVSSGKTSADWCGPLYQNANRLAHLCWLRSHGVRSLLVHLLFTGDPHGATTEAEWKAALKKADDELGLAGVAVEQAGHVFLPAGSRDELLG